MAWQAVDPRALLAAALLAATVGATHPQPAGPSHLGVTEYCLRGVMADGRRVHRGAAASNYYPLGERLWVDGFGEVTVEDRSAPGATFVDLWVTDCGEAWQWGRRNAAVYDEGRGRAED